MKCTRCQRELAPELSMCVSCGAMRDDSVREELESSLTPIANPVRFHFVEERADAVPVPASAVKNLPEPAPVVPVAAAPVPPTPEAKPERRFQTADLGTKKTSPTLAEFVNKNSKIPDWRLQLQNTVRQRNGRHSVNAVSTNTVSGQARTRTSGANALKLDYAEAAKASETAPEPDTKLTNALKRIEASRKAYLPTEKAREGMRVAKEASKKFPYKVVSRSEDLPEIPVKVSGEPAMTVRPKLVSSLKIEKKEYDTNKLIPVPEAARMASSFEETEAGPTDEKALPKEKWSQRIEIRDSSTQTSTAASELPLAEEAEPETDEIDDLAPIAMRFNAGLFDLIIGGFATFTILSPLLGWAEGWFSLSGLLLFISVMLVVMFLYLTAAIAFLGQTFGMKIFSLELVDVEQSEFPTLHQAAVNSAVYLFSLAFAGLGFIPVFLNDERRAVHDLVSGTILVREI